MSMSGSRCNKLLRRKGVQCVMDGNKKVKLSRDRYGVAIDFCSRVCVCVRQDIELDPNVRVSRSLFERNSGNHNMEIEQAIKSITKRKKHRSKR